MAGVIQSAAETNTAFSAASISGRQRQRLARLEARILWAPDDRALVRAVDSMNRQALRAAGAAVMRISRASMKKAGTKRGKGSAAPGSPPRSRSPFGIRDGNRSVNFDVYPARRPTHVVIGPLAARAQPRVPHALEYGGMAEMTIRINPKTQGTRRQGKRRGGSKTGARPVLNEADRQRKKQYFKSLRSKQILVRRRPYPYMRPTFEKVTRKAGRFWFRKLKRVG